MGARVSVLYFHDFKGGQGDFFTLPRLRGLRGLLGWYVSLLVGWGSRVGMELTVAVLAGYLAYEDCSDEDGDGCAYSIV